jgi:HSP20 family protein
VAKEESKNTEQRNQNSPTPAPGSQQQQRGLTRGRIPGARGMSADVFGAGPFTLLRRMTEEMDRVFGEVADYSGSGGEHIWAAALEVSEHDGNYIVRAELPGIKPEDVKLEITDDSVVLQGERKSEKQESKGGVRHTERHYGHFYRAVPLPEGAKTDDAKANFDDGVLEVTVPVPERRRKPREIRIQAGSEPHQLSSGRT